MKKDFIANALLPKRALPSRHTTPLPNHHMLDSTGNGWRYDYLRVNLTLECRHAPLC